MLIVIPYIDNLDLTALTLEDALAQQDVGDIRVLLIDQASSPEGRAWGDAMQLKHERQVLCWHFHPQLSLGAAWNRAMQFAEASEEEGALVVNNDVRMRASTAGTLQEIAQALDAYFVSGVGVDEASWAAQGGKPIQVLADGRGGPDCSCFYLTLQGWHAYPFDEHFFPAYNEDIDLHRRMLLGGDGEKMFGVNLPFLHKTSSTINQSSEHRRRLTEMLHESYAYFERCWGGQPNHETFMEKFDKPLHGHDARLRRRRETGAWTTPALFKYIQEGRAVELDALLAKCRVNIPDSVEA